MKKLSETLNCEKHKAISTPCCPVCLMTMFNTLKAKNEELRQGIINDRNDVVLVPKEQYDKLKTSRDKLVEDVRKTIHYINGTGEVNKWKISNWLDQALKECEQ